MTNADNGPSTCTDPVVLWRDEIDMPAEIANIMDADFANNRSYID